MYFFLIMENKVRDGSLALVAFGGNVIHKTDETGTFAEQQANARVMCRQLIPIITKGYELVVTHGNGPQVGSLLMQNAMAHETVPEMPLDVLVAQTEGSLGYILQQELLNALRQNSIRKYVVTMITQVVVDSKDPAFKDPQKPVGPFYSKKEIEKLQKRFPDWQVTEDAGRGYRRIVPSPFPQRIIQSPMIRSLAYAGNIVLALGGGGIPIAKGPDNQYAGIEAVIDKDVSSALLATDIKADLFILLTNTDRVYLDYGTPEARPLDQMNCWEAEQYLRQGQFPPGSMGPKIRAAMLYLQGGGRDVLITSPQHLEAALDGKSGTRLVWK